MINKLKEIAAGWVNLAWDQLDMLDEDTKKKVREELRYVMVVN